MIWGAMTALVSVLTLCLASCSNNNDDPAETKLEINKRELGEENSKTAVLGKDLHIECEILAESKIKSIRVELIQGNAETVLMKDFNSNKNYVGVINAHFHEHLELDGKLAAGTYRFILTVTDEKGKEVSWTDELTLKAPDPNAPKIEITSPDASNNGKTGTFEFSKEITVPAEAVAGEYHLHFTVTDTDGRTNTEEFEGFKITAKK